MSRIARYSLRLAGLAAYLLVAFGRAETLAQGRRIVRLTPPREPARYFAVSLEAYSFGLGTLESARPGWDSGVLRSSIVRDPSFRVARRVHPPGRPRAPAPLPARVAKPGSRPLPELPPSIPPRWLMARPSPTGRRPSCVALVSRERGGDVLDLTYDYLEAIGAMPTDLLKDPSSYITTLVPDRPGVYRLYMARGEAAFRSGDFASAFDELRIAHDISGPSAESLLGLAHTRAAAGTGSYASASFYLQQALRKLPELPLTPLKPMALFGSEAMYRTCVGRLAAHVVRRPGDVDALLLCAYFLWFEGKGAAARQALRRAADARRARQSDPDSPGDRVLEAIEILARGIAATAPPEGTDPPGARPAATATTAPAAARPPT